MVQTRRSGVHEDRSCANVYRGNNRAFHIPLESTIAFSSRSLSKSEKVYSSVEKEALPIVESFWKYDNLLKTYRVLVKIDMRSVAFIFADDKSKVKNEKLMRWRLELDVFRHDISYMSAVDNVGVDALSRIAAIGSSPRIPKLLDLHSNLAHPGITRMWNYVRRHNLPFSHEDIKTFYKTGEVCCVTKPRFVMSMNRK